MIKLRVLDLLQEQGRTKYWLAKHIGMSHQHINRLANNQTRTIRLETMERLCTLLNCEPKDLFHLVHDQAETIKSSMEL